MAFSKTRNIELSVVDAIETAVNANWSGVTVVKAFLQSYTSTLPVICVRMLSIDSKRQEIGANTLQHEYSFIIDIFAKSDGQRIDLTDFIMNLVKDGFIYNEFARGSGDVFTKTPNGRIVFLRFYSDNRIDGNDSEAEHDRYRQSITFTVSKYD